MSRRYSWSRSPAAGERPSSASRWTPTHPPNGRASASRRCWVVTDCRRTRPRLQARTREALAETASYVAEMADRFLSGSPAALDQLRAWRHAGTVAYYQELRELGRRRERSAAWRAEHPDLVRDPAEVLAEARVAWDRRGGQAGPAPYEFRYEKLGESLDDDFARMYSLKAYVHELRRTARRRALGQGGSYAPTPPWQPAW